MPEPLVLVGGTFDPPHIGHLVLAECARVQLGARFAIFLPAGDPWRKTGSAPGPEPQTGRQVTPAMQRLQMTRLATRDNASFRVDDREIRRSGPTYTVDTLEEFHREGHSNLVLVIGSDALADIENWKEPGRIRELARLAIAEKPGSELPSLPTSETVERIDMPRLAISSTEIRARVGAGKPFRYLVPAAVEAYIAEHHLYRPDAPRPRKHGGE